MSNVPQPTRSFSAWLSQRGMAPRFGCAVARYLGIRDLADLRACAEEPTIRAEFLDAARQRLPFASYAALRRLVKTMAVPMLHSPIETSLGPGEVRQLAPALLEAIVVTLSTLSQELLQAAHRFAALDPGLDLGVDMGFTDVQDTDINPACSTAIHDDVEEEEEMLESSQGHYAPDMCCADPIASANNKDHGEQTWSADTEGSWGTVQVKREVNGEADPQPVPKEVADEDANTSGGGGGGGGGCIGSGDTLEWKVDVDSRSCTMRTRSFDSTSSTLPAFCNESEPSQPGHSNTSSHEPSRSSWTPGMPTAAPFGPDIPPASHILSDAGDVQLLEAQLLSPDQCGTILDSNSPYNMLPVDHFNLVDDTPGQAMLSEENEGVDDLQTNLARDCRPHKRKRPPTKLVHLGPGEDDQQSSSEVQNEDEKIPLVMLPRMIDLQETIHSQHATSRGAFPGATVDVVDEETFIKVETTSESPIMYGTEGSNLHSGSPGLCLPVDKTRGCKPEIEPSEVGREEETEIGDVDANGGGMVSREVTTCSVDKNSGNTTILPYDQADMNVHVDETYCVATASGQRRWQCRLCEKSYTSKYNLVTHILGHSGIKPHACSQCGKLFKQLSHLHTHQLTHAGARPHGCHVCGRAFTQTSHLKRHLMQHSAIRPHVCTLCGRGFAYPSELRAHEARHANEPQRPRGPVCNACGLSCSSAAMLKQHKALVHHEVSDNLKGQPANSNPATFCCHECGRTFQYRSQLQNHALSHCDVRPYICAECGMEFVQSHHLKQHMLIHKGIKEHKCDVCGRGFTLQANMKRHLLTHSSERQYACSLCHKTFTQKQTLKAHMIVHSEKKPFKCKVCNKEFNRLHNLMGHLHLHTTRKPFQCLHCPSKFTLKGNLTRHTKVKHGRNNGTYNGSLNTSEHSSLNSKLSNSTPSPDSALSIPPWAGWLPSETAHLPYSFGDGDRRVRAWHTGTMWQQQEPFDLSGRCWKAAGECVQPLVEGQKSPSDLQGQVDLRHCFSGVDPRDPVILGAVGYETKYRLLTAPPFLHGTCY